MGFFLVLKAEFIRGLIIMRRYWFATMIGILMTYGILIGGILSLSKRGVESKIGSLVTNPEKAGGWALGFVIGTFAFGIVGMFTQRLRGMARTGQLEQVCMSPHGLVTNFMARTVVSAITSMISLAIIFTMVSMTVGSKVHIDIVATSILLVLTYIDLIGFGFMCGGLVLVFKQTGQLAMLVRMALLALAVGASENIHNWLPVVRWIAHILPVTDAAICLKYVLIEGQSSGPFYQHPSFFILVINSLAWTSIGIILFKTMENWSRDKGTLGVY